MKTTLTSLLLMLWLASNGQEIPRSTLSSSGGTISKENIVISWTLGELVGGTSLVNKTNLTEGFLQPIFLLEKVNAEEVKSRKVPNKSIDLSLTVFPNPIVSEVIILANTQEEIDLQFDIVDQAGRKVNAERPLFPNIETKVEFGGFPSGIYFIRFTNSQNEIIESYKVMKSN